MKYALNLAEDNRILSATYEQYAPECAVLVVELPEGNIADYIYQDGVYIYDPLPAPTMSEEEVRAERDRLLAETDWTQVLDAPISAECREAFRVYRQALRDIPEQEGFPESVVFPVMPKVEKAEPDPVDTAVDVLLGEGEV